MNHAAEKLLRWYADCELRVSDEQIDLRKQLHVVALKLCIKVETGGGRTGC
ncbi:hypothetical protein KIN20_010010 [Parelaphostrongylus tenuis]|uniref:Uncharacterized protein n=1 Tax=Parelaphostrongylus tenuis TaxID=148309 RepID=A0AAD5QL20_PARTN|nr:hypothetical protein KIN20_010010 [Parelaphostrongylus tenuis]